MADLAARRQAELRLRVGEHLAPGEEYLAGLWVARDPGLPLVSRITQWPGAPQGVLGLSGTVVSANPEIGLDGPGGSTAAALDRHVPEPASAAALALTGSHLRLLLIAAEQPVVAGAAPAGPADRLRRLFTRAPAPPLPALTPVWHCPRAALAEAVASDPEGRLTLRFADGSSLSVLAPALPASTFAEAGGFRRTGKSG